MTKNLKEFVSICVNKYKERTAFTYRADDFVINKTYEDLNNDINKLGAKILSEGFYDCKISLVGENSYEYIVTYLAIIGGKNTVVPIDKDLSSGQIQEQVARTKSKCVFYSKSVEHKIDRTNPEISGKYFCLDNILNITNINSDKYEKIEIDENYTASIIFTSGTTGVSKGVMLSHRNIITCAENCLEPSGIDFNENNRTVVVLPLHHTYGMTAGVLAVLNEGTSNYINKNLCDFIKDIDEYKPNVMFLVPLFVENLFKIMGKGLLKNNVIHYIISGGAMLDIKYLKAFEKMGILIINGYGITECAPVVSINNCHKIKEGSIGAPICYNKVEIDTPDENGEGEILVKGSNVMQGYFENAAATKEAFKDKWFRTGDYGRIDQEGNLYITGRKKNIIILSNGKNIYPEELEAEVYKIPLVKEALVYSCDDDKISLEVYLDTEYISAMNIEQPHEKFDKALNKLNSELPFYKKIQEYNVRDTEFPKTSTKKIIRGGITAKENKKPNYRTGTTKTEIMLIKILKEEYRQQDIYLDDKVFKIINDSLSALTTICELEKAFNTKIPWAVLSDNPSIEELGMRIDHTIQNNDCNEENIEINLNNLKVNPQNNKRNYLLTGATGFFGIHLLSECIEERKVYCLVRDLRKFPSCLEYYLGLKVHSNIIPIEGDITKHNLGLSRRDLALVKKDVGVIINSAADVKHFGSLDSSRRTNVDGIIHAIYLAAEIGAKLEHISTMTVCGEGLVSQTTKDIFDENSLYIGQAYQENIYVHSKYTAEKAIHAARDKGLTANIYRLGNLTERASDGLFQINFAENGFRARMDAIKAVRALPEELFDLPVDYTYVDECAKAVKLLISLNENNETYHIYNHNTVSLKEYVDGFDLDIDKMPFSEFVKKLKNISHKNKNAKILLLYLSKMSQGEKFERVNIRSDKTLNKLLKLGFRWKRFSHKNIIKFEVDTNFSNDILA